jgi:putative transcriptional regulator
MGEVNNRLAEFRKQANLSQEDLADKIGVRRQTIIRIESGKFYPSLWVAHEIAHILDKQIEEIFFPENEM